MIILRERLNRSLAEKNEPLIQDREWDFVKNQLWLRNVNSDVDFRDLKKDILAARNAFGRTQRVEMLPEMVLNRGAAPIRATALALLAARNASKWKSVIQFRKN